jgi:hypothetical protein
MKARTVVAIPWKRLYSIARSSRPALRKEVSGAGKQGGLFLTSSWFAGPICAFLALGFVSCFYVIQNALGSGEPFAWLDGISAWPSIAIILFAALLSVHFILKTNLDLTKNAAALGEAFGLNGRPVTKVPFFGWESTPLKSADASGSSPGGRADAEQRIDIEFLWQRYICRGRFLTRMTRTLPMTSLYIVGLFAIRPIIGDFPRAPIRGDFPFLLLIVLTISVFLFLTFFVIDAIFLHEGFLIQLEKKETCWPDATFKRFEYSIIPSRPLNEADLADYWDILLISKRTEAVGRLIYYPFIILSLLILARLSYFDNWTWSPVVVVALSMHFSLALYAAWRLPKAARAYRDKVLERLKRRRRQALMLAQRMPEVSDTMIEEVQSTHQGAFSYLWEQPAIRALLLPSSGLGLATLLQFLPR